MTGWTLAAGVLLAFALNVARNADRPSRSSQNTSAPMDQAPIAKFTRPQPVPDNTIPFESDMRRKHQMGDQAVAMTRPCMRQAALARLQLGERDRQRLEQFVIRLCAVPIRQTMASLNEPGAEELLKVLATVEVENAVVLGR